MKAKLLFTFFFLLFFLQPITSQEYHPLLNNSSWIVNDVVLCCRPPYVRVINEGIDVVVGDYTYKKFNDPFPKYDLATETYIDSISVREDIETRKVYKLVNGAEVLLFDFSMETGDTLSQFGFTWQATVDDCNVNGSNRKRITLHTIELWNNHSLTQIWIEGVGTTCHPFYPERNMYNVMSSGGGTNYFTKCSFQNGEHIYGNPECVALLPSLSTTNLTSTESQIAFFPNPFVDELTVASDFEFDNATLRLFNIQGQLVRQINNISGKSISVGRENLHSGLYVAQISENGIVIRTKKIIVR